MKTYKIAIDINSIHIKVAASSEDEAIKRARGFFKRDYPMLDEFLPDGYEAVILEVADIKEP